MPKQTGNMLSGQWKAKACGSVRKLTSFNYGKYDKIFQIKQAVISNMVFFKLIFSL